MTTTCAVAARFKAVGCIVILSAVLAGCGSSNLLGDSDTQTAATAPISAQPAAAQPAVSSSRVAIAPITGAPDAVGRDFTSQLNSSLARQRVAVAPAGDGADYTLRGYMVATKEKSSTKVSYIFDLVDSTGKRVNRIQGEETAAASGGEPWSALTADLSQKISDKAAASLAQSLASISPAASGAAPVGVGASSVARGAAAGGGEAAVQTASIAPSAGPAATGGLAVIEPTVTGAPGDGNTSLAAAMRDELKQAGLATLPPGQKGYGVASRVTMGAIKDSKQSIKIDWRVTEPNGSVLATVSQNNEIQAGLVDGPWGPLANDAAQGAAAKIKQLIEEHRAASASGAPRQKTASRSKG